jgi:hypothetical protein
MGVTHRVNRQVGHFVTALDVRKRGAARVNTAGCSRSPGPSLLSEQPQKPTEAITASAAEISRFPLIVWIVPERRASKRGPRRGRVAFGYIAVEAAPSHLRT